MKCLECGHKFKTLKAAELATWHGCPKCGGVDIDIDMAAYEAVFPLMANGAELLGFA